MREDAPQREYSVRKVFNGTHRVPGSKVHLAVDTLGHLLALHVTPAHEHDRPQVATLAAQVQEVTGISVEVCLR